MVKRLFALAALVAFVVPGGALSQIVRPAHITVSKAVQSDDADAGMFSTIQAAVNAAEPGWIIEIQDTEVYEEQVTIDGRETSEWPGVDGGKNGITIRSRNPTSVVKPVIRWRDTLNQSPKTSTEAGISGELRGTSGNFETCGALRIIRAQNVTIDGITVDGGGAAPFWWPSIWMPGGAPLFHGNAAITLVVASGTVIRNSEMRNAYFGVNIKDRNTGGVFGNRNPADNDNTIPLSGFGRVGAHLIEHNRVHSNSLAFFIESAWDLGSSIRYNLIYNNNHTPVTRTFLAQERITDRDNHGAGGFMFKDNIYSPVAIYNNTFFNNYANYYAHWKVGAPHLLFNNIHGKPSNPLGPNAPALQYVGGMGMDDKFPFRMHNSVFAAISSLDGQATGAYIQQCNGNVPGYYDYVSVVHYFSAIEATMGEVQCPDGRTVQASAFHPGTPLTSTNGLDASAGVRWLETSVRHRAGDVVVPGTEDLFVSTEPSSPDFLRPIWSHRMVERFIKNKGWEGIGIRNSDGAMADIGAVPSSAARQPTVVRIKPSNVVMIRADNRTADVSFFVTLEGGQFNNPRVKFMRWVAPLPEVAVAGNFGREAPVVPGNSIQPIVPLPTAPIAVNSNNSFPIPLPRAMTASDTYGFFEVVLEGTDGNGHTVTSDIGFLPYRQLEYVLKLEVLNEAGTVVTEVIAGEPYRLRVTAQGANGITFSLGNLNNLGLSLHSTDAAPRMICRESSSRCAAEQPLTGDTDVPTQVTYPVYFERAGNTVIVGNGYYNAGTAGHLVFLGNTEINVLPGPPSQISFISPIPKSSLEGALPPVINRGADFPVMVEVQDRFGNGVGPGHNVSISAANSIPADGEAIGDAGSPSNISVKTVNTDSAGIAHFTARTTTAAMPGNVFDLTASVTLPGGNTVSDVGSLRVGRTLDALQVFYSDAATGYNEDAVINGMVGEWFLITVRAMVGDSVLTGRTQFVHVEPSNSGLLFSATEGGAPATVFPLTNGVATFWVGADYETTTDIQNACVLVTALRSNDAANVDGSIGAGSRCGISFTVPQSSIAKGVVYGNGHGVPDSVVLHYGNDGTGRGFNGPGFPLPDSVMLSWPSAANPAAEVSVTVPRANFTVLDDYVLGVSFRGLSAPFAPGHTGIEGNGWGVVTVYGGLNGATSVEYMFDVLDGIGPVLADASDMRDGYINPRIVENPNSGTAPDTLIIQISEGILDEVDLENASSVFYVRGPAAPNNDPATGGEYLSIARALPPSANNTIKLVLASGSYVPVAGDWIRLSSASDLLDNAASTRHEHPSNGPHVNSRWVQVEEQPVPPSVVGGYYTSDVRTGIVDYAYVTFNKPVAINTWFSGGFFKFGETAPDSGRSPARFISLADGSDATVVIDLSVAFPTSQPRTITRADSVAAIRTSGIMPVTIGFTPGFDGWPEMDVPLADSAKPVLAADSAVLRRGVLRDGGGYEPDTLIVTYSEAMPQGLYAIGSPLAIMSRESRESVTPVLTSCTPASVTGTSYTRVTCLIEPNSDGTRLSFSSGDSVYIAPAAGVSDAVTPPNVQNDPNNRRVGLRVHYNTRWAYTIANNPFRREGSATIKLNPGNVRLKIEATVRIFDRLGNIVRSEKHEIPSTTDGYQWEWDGRNQNGRYVGTGTYLFAPTIDYWVVREDGSVDEGSKARFGGADARRLIGFVR